MGNVSQARIKIPDWSGRERNDRKKIALCSSLQNLTLSKYLENAKASLIHIYLSALLLIEGFQTHDAPGLLGFRDRFRYLAFCIEKKNEAIKRYVEIKMQKRQIYS